MRVRARTDRNHAEIVAALRGIGASVLSLHQVGAGCPDVLVGWRGMVNLLIEIKDGEKPPSARVLTADERDFHAKWAGPVAVAGSGEEAIERLLAVAKEVGAV